MSLIQTNTSLFHREEGINFTNSFQRTSNEEGVYVIPIEATTSATTISTPTFITPREYRFNNLEGDVLLVSLDNGSTWPIGIDEGNDNTITLDLSATREVSTVTAVADSYGSLSGAYFDVEDRAGVVRVWLNTGEYATGSITFGSPDNGDEVIVDGNTFTKVAAAPGANEFTDIAELEALVEAVTGVDSVVDGGDIDIRASTVGAAGNAITLAVGGGNTGTMAVSGTNLTGGLDDSADPGGGARRLEVAVTPNSTAAQVAVAIAAVVDADAEFVSEVPTTAVLTITDQHAGVRAPIASSDFTVATVVNATALPTIKVKSVGTSQAKVIVIPN